MESPMKFKPDTYYIGDPGCVLSNDDLRGLFTEFMHGGIKSGVKPVIASLRYDKNEFISDYYWIATLPNKRGTLYDQNGKGYGFDWGCFGVIPWKWIEPKGSFLMNKFEFDNSFECLNNDSEIIIGNIIFTFNLK